LKRRLTFIHTAAAALNSLNEFYSKEATDFEITNLLDDGLMRLFSETKYDEVQSRFVQMVKTAQELYKAELVMLTCSAVPSSMMDHLRKINEIPVLKIDEPMATEAVKSGNRLGVIITFAPTLEPTCKLLSETAAKIDKRIEIISKVLPEAYEALSKGDKNKHDQAIIKAIKDLNQEKADSIVLAQVSMAHVVKKIAEDTSVPVFSSLHTSLKTIKELLESRTKWKE
jgi:Asp/Glu/hydantoin racemase